MAAACSSGGRRWPLSVQIGALLLVLAAVVMIVEFRATNSSFAQETLKETADTVLKKLGVKDPLLDTAKRLEEAALEDSYFVERKLYPNVDFYSGIIYKALKIPTDMFTVMFAIARTAGWVAHWLEQQTDPEFRIGRPRQIYTGAVTRDYVGLDKR